ncbi:hypothetical protein HU765_10895 [Pseudomonas sp. SWRI81]|uniref:hypothetical protein n=1 Tax=Pseudomonas sp. SWRI81 TaxID=2745505 RepID=UPI001647A77B|nr:hypothetical protein [Pseudomonas sp. SWRI81]MBC3270433.1 hypothetical protein [Pseudomonas sp. SWRI81]
MQRSEYTDDDLLEVPQVPAILKDEEGKESPDGLLPRSVLAEDLTVVIPDWSAPFEDPIPFIVIISWVAQGGPFTEVYREPFDDPGEKTLVVPRDKLNFDHGTYSLSYRVSYGGNPLDSEIKRVTVDRSPPNDNQEPDPLILLDVAGDITDDYLSQHGEVRFQVPFYVDARGKDRAIYYWTEDPDPPDSEIEIAEQEFSQEDIDQKRLIITMTEADIRDSGPGQRFIYYRLRDWSGNRGPRSTLLPAFVNLNPAPGKLKPPKVPLSVRGFIDREHAREGAVNQRAVTVEIDEYENPDPSDKVLIDWNGHALTPLDVDPGKFPQVAIVPWMTLTADGLGPLNVRVSYRIQRGGTPTLPSADTRVMVNLTIAGQDHANAPALLNTTLAKVEVYGARSRQLNKLLTIDFGEPAEAHLRLYDAPLLGEKLFLYWGAISTPIAEYEVQAGDVAGKLLIFIVPWEAIEQDKVNPSLPTWYTTSNGVNLQQADATTVDIAIIVIENLPEPTFPHANMHGQLHCCSKPRLWEGVFVHISGNAAFDEDDIVELSWQGCSGLNGTDPIDGTDETFKTTLTAEQAREGFDVHVSDYERLIAPMVNDGSALCSYHLKKANGGIGNSMPEFVLINRTWPSGAVCSPDNDLCEV